MRVVYSPDESLEQHAISFNLPVLFALPFLVQIQQVLIHQNIHILFLFAKI